MDVLDEAKLQIAGKALIDHAQQALDAELAKAQSAIASERNSAATVLSNLISAILLGTQAIEGRAAANLKELRDSCDGWTATITIPPITIRLTKPKGE